MRRLRPRMKPLRHILSRRQAHFASRQVSTTGAGFAGCAKLMVYGSRISRVACPRARQHAHAKPHRSFASVGMLVLRESMPPGFRASSITNGRLESLPHGLLFWTGAGAGRIRYSNQLVPELVVDLRLGDDPVVVMINRHAQPVLRRRSIRVERPRFPGTRGSCRGRPV